MSTSLSGAAAAFDGGLRPLGSGVFAWIQPDGGWGESNAGLVVGDGASAVIDTPWDQRLARGMLGAMAEHTDGAPVRLAVNTHSDGDHWWGNAELPESTTIVTSKESLAAMKEEAPPKELARLRRLAGISGKVPGRSGEMGRYVRSMLGPFDFKGVQLRLPEETYEGRSTEHVGGRALELRTVGPAHTLGDLVVHVPDAGVVFAADILFVGVTPVMWAGPVSNWIAALDLLLELDADTIVPGHGPVCGPDGVRAMRDYWTWLEEAVLMQHRFGHSARQATLEIVRSDGFGAYRDWLLPERMVISVTAMLRHMAGKGRVPHTAAMRAALFDQVSIVKRTLAEA
ncbi:MBL fold metallo-hydrolase [Patulibacter sp. NPDC049589]|uniref:MBL fold metallo-hydrolase n=1 Tax=Patulibacter sp. NPDC049589 TaxID=3154731 RepID=UPI00341C48EA